MQEHQVVDILGAFMGCMWTNKSSFDILVLFWVFLFIKYVKSKLFTNKMQNMQHIFWGECIMSGTKNIYYSLIIDSTCLHSFSFTQ